MSCKWVEGRVPSIDPVVLRRRCAIPLEQVIAEDGRQQTHFRYPASGCRGIGDLWRRFAAKFPADVFQLRQQVVQIDSREKKVRRSIYDKRKYLFCFM
jgi:hypothetical protein